LNVLVYRDIKDQPDIKGLRDRRQIQVLQDPVDPLVLLDLQGLMDLHQTQVLQDLLDREVQVIRASKASKASKASRESKESME
jgi:hypothetical protein